MNYALEAGVSPDMLRACLQRRFADAGAAGLGFRFAEAAISGSPVADDLRSEIERKYGQRAVLAAAFAAATSRAYPVLKRALGHGQACQRLEIGAGPQEPVTRAA